MSTVTLSASHDAFVDQDTPGTNYNGQGRIVCGFDNDIIYGGDNGLCRGFVGFDLSSIPAGSTINSAALTFLGYYDANGYNAWTLRIMRVASTSWDETTLTWANQPSLTSLTYDIASTGNAQGVVSIPVTVDVSNSLSSGRASWAFTQLGEATGGVWSNFAEREYGTGYPTLFVNYTAPTTVKDVFRLFWPFAFLLTLWK